MKSGQLIEKLKSGELLEKKHPIGESEWLFHEEGYGFEMKGWGTAYGGVTDRIMDILTHPENWKISEFKIEDYPWSVKN